MNKTKPKKFTFKNRERSIGLMAIGSGTPSIDIKYTGVEVGFINFNDAWNSKRDGISIHLQIPRDSNKITVESPCKWKWVCINERFKTADEAKKYLNDNFKFFGKQIYLDVE